MVGKVYVVWKEKEDVRKVENISDLIKDYFEIVPEIVRKKGMEVELVYNRSGDGVFEVVEESVMIATEAKLIGSYNDGNAEIFRYRVGKWAVVLHKSEDNWNAGFEWSVREAKIVMHGRVPRSIIKRIEEAVEELRKQIA